jgi:hypothetical protein
LILSKSVLLAIRAAKSVRLRAVHLRILRTLLLAALIYQAPCERLWAQFDGAPPPSTTAPTNAPIREISPGLFQVGKVTIDKNKRTASFPAVLNINDAAAIEYLVVTDGGKIHESAFRTTAEPYHINLALLLLGATGAGTNTFPRTNSQPIPGDKIQLEVSWVNLEKTVRLPAERLIENRVTKTPMATGPWIYTGSQLYEGTFLAQAEGSIISVIIDPVAIINNPRAGAEDDELWQVRTNELPPLNWPLEITIRVPPTPSRR